MSYKLEQLAADCRAALMSNEGPEGREAVRGYVQRACVDAAFVAEHLGPDNRAERKILYEDPELGFCIIAHVYGGAKSSPPHDHGPSWAIYGQVEGETEMVDWRKLEPPSNGRPGKVERVRTYTLAPGDALVYNEGDLHSPERYSGTRLLRIEGTNMEKVERDRYEAE